MELPSTFSPELHDLEEIRELKPLYSRLGKTKLEVFKLGLGTGIGFGAVDFDDQGEPFGPEYQVRVSAVRKALKAGINYIDTAPLYAAGKAERVVGKIIQGLPRESFHLATKVGRNHECKFDYSPQGIRETFEKSLSNLRVEMVDLVTIHDIEFADNLDLIVKDVLPVLEQFVREGKVSYIGCSGYPLEPLVNLTEAAKGRLDYILSYSRLTLFNTDLLKCSSLLTNDSIGLINASMLGMGLLTPNVLENPPVPYWHPASPELVNLCRTAAQICQREGVDLPRIATHFSMNKSPRVNLNLVGAITPEHVDNNLSLLKQGLTEKEMKVQSQIEKLFRSGPSNHWEGVEVSQYRADPQGFADNLLNGPKSAQ